MNTVTTCQKTMNSFAFFLCEYTPIISRSLVLFLSANSSFSTKRCYFHDKSKFTEFLLSIELLMLHFSFTEKKPISEPCPTTWTRTHGVRGARTSRVKVLRQPLEISPACGVSISKPNKV